MTAATMLAAKSEIGMLIHIPFEPQNMGKIMMQGNRKKQLAGKGQEDSLGCHSDTLEKVGSNHLKTDNGKNMTTIRSPVAERSINPSWVVKADTASSGISSPTRNPLVVTRVAP